MDNAKGHLVFCNLSFNSDVFTLDVNFFYVLVSVAGGGMYGSISGKKCWEVAK
jgi:hypothetical protein